ncbi:hypothetical protein [Roseisolibacter sp. H3M3-2]|uniref:hypothetical protein n=1 Tax=Roseisolibacter sp. H3M3-2 TaxID=3031323 RepID=UPI0023DABC1F|nr:hypothetical protein [Roseisolibacter sp. H3M3-2]MDF1501761.1 hypothetical protein [Roseisolibacter sp. H3M3-2]
MPRRRPSAAMAALAVPAALSLAGALAACASQPAVAVVGEQPPRREFVAIGDQVVRLEPSVARTLHEDLALTVDQAWGALPLAYEALGLALTTLDSEQRRVGAGGQRVQGRLRGAWMSRYVDCGTAANGLPHADSYAVTLDVLSQVEGRADVAAASVSTTVKAVGRPASVSSSNVVNCTTTGNLERRVAELVRAEAAKLR